MVVMPVRCSNCRYELDEAQDIPYEERTPCPQCGSLSRIVEGAATLSVRATVSTSAAVERGLNATRLAVLGILVGVALAAASLANAWWTRLAAGLATFLLACAVIRVPWTREKMMRFMHWLTGA
jgi:DNA-directed RNA polymerase subunit RPC12/RpoP